jgi:2-polyprenyl-3-methyl-5-hydroxy-6-metoxy-1,4-benzoquinol methylase
MSSAATLPATAQIRTQPHIACILCGTAGTVLYRDLTDPFFGAPGLWQLKKCPRIGCGLIWLDPAPLEADLHLAYQAYFTHGALDGKARLVSQLRNFLYRAYQAVNYLPAALLGLHAAKSEMSRMFLGDLQPGKVLDVGCGDGMFLNRMRGLGWTVDGVDFDAKAVTNAWLKYGLELRHGDLAGARFAENSFDAVTMSHVIEHVPDPVALLAEARRILKPGGRLVVTTPNTGSYGHEKFQGYWFGVDPPRHLHLYSLDTLRECARRAGLEVVRAVSTAANADIFIGGSFSIRDSAGHRTDAHPRPRLLRTLKTIFLQYREHSQLRARPGYGEEAVLICAKSA